MPVPARNGLNLYRVGGVGNGEQAWGWIGEAGVADIAGISPGRYRVEAYPTSTALVGEFDLAADQAECAVVLTPKAGG